MLDYFKYLLNAKGINNIDAPFVQGLVTEGLNEPKGYDYRNFNYFIPERMEVKEAKKAYRIIRYLNPKLIYSDKYVQPLIHHVDAPHELVVVNNDLSNLEEGCLFVFIAEQFTNHFKAGMLHFPKNSTVLFLNLQEEEIYRTYFLERSDLSNIHLSIDGWNWGLWSNKEEFTRKEHFTLR